MATYKYYNMDQVVAQALTLYSRLGGHHRADAATTGARMPIAAVARPNWGELAGTSGSSWFTER